MWYSSLPAVRLPAQVRLNKVNQMCYADIVCKLELMEPCCSGEHAGRRGLGRDEGCCLERPLELQPGRSGAHSPLPSGYPAASLDRPA